MRAFVLGLALAWALACGTVAGARSAPVLMISVDGLQPLDVIEAEARGFSAPNIRALMAEGAYASGVKNVLPTVTYPNHASLITGTFPAEHGISNNTVFDPLGKNQGGWYWYASDIKAETLWDAVHAKGGRVASLGWPVSVGAHAIDDNIPEYWRARIPEDLKLLRALSTPGLVEDLERAAEMPLGAIYTEEVEGDEARARFAAKLIALRKPEFTTLHLVALDHFEHEEGPGSDKAKATLARIDAAIGDLVKAARAIDPGYIVAVVSDHGFAPVASDVHLQIPFIEAGLLTLDPATKRVSAWEAAIWSGGAGAAIVLARPNDKALAAKAGALLESLAARPELGIERILARPEIARRGGPVEASFFVAFRPGFQPGRATSGPLVTPSAIKGNHGYLPDHKEMRASFFISGEGVPKRALGEIDMRAIAPTLARLMGVSLPAADLKPLF